METISNLFWTIVLLVIAMIICGTIIGIVQCAKGGDDGWRNNFAVTVVSETDEYTEYIISNDSSNPIAGENKYIYIESMTFRVRTSTGRDIDYVFTADFQPMAPFSSMRFTVTTAQIKEFMIYNGIPGEVKSFKLIDIKHEWRDLAAEGTLERIPSAA